MESRRAGDISRSRRLGQMAGIEGTIHRAIRRCGGLLAQRRHRGCLTTGHTVNIVVEKYHRQVDIPTAAMDKVVAANSRAVAIACDNHDVEIRIGQFNSRRERNCTAMGRMQSIKIHVARST